MKSCLVIMMLIGVGYTSTPCWGDLNCDHTVNILDLVELASCVISQSCVDIEICAWCLGECHTADTNQADIADPYQSWNVLDCIELVNCILANSNSPVDSCPIP